jgi:hypothetical protein
MPHESPPKRQASAPPVGEKDLLDAQIDQDDELMLKEQVKILKVEEKEIEAVAGWVHDELVAWIEHNQDFIMGFRLEAKLTNIFELLATKFGRPGMDFEQLIGFSEGVSYRDSDGPTNGQIKFMDQTLPFCFNGEGLDFYFTVPDQAVKMAVRNAVEKFFKMIIL